MPSKSNGHYDKEEIKRSIQGRGLGLLISIGIPSESLDGKHHPCPKCGGKDRFRALDIEKGVLFCNQCFSQGNGDGISTVKWWLDCTFPEAVNKVGEYLNLSLSKPVKNRDPVPKKKAKPFADQIQFIDFNQGKLNS